MLNSKSNKFYVETLKNHRVSGLILSDCAYPAELKTPQHAHENAFFGFVLKGAYSESYKNRSLTFEPSSLAFHPSGEVHKTHFHNAGGHILRIEVEPVWLEKTRGLSPSLAAPANFRGTELTRLSHKLYREFHRMDHVSPFAIEGLMLEILVEVSRSAEAANAERRFPRWLAQVQEILHAHFKESLSLPEIAATVNIHPVYLARIFRKHFHCTVGDYVRNLRLEFVRSQLASSDTPFVEIALAAGFCDQSHFNGFFKRETGLTPGEYRNMFRRVNPAKKGFVSSIHTKI